jgi:alkaline phosphatase D
MVLRIIDESKLQVEFITFVHLIMLGRYRQIYASPDWPAVGQNLSWIHVLDDREISDNYDDRDTEIYRTATDPWHHYQASVNPPLARKAGARGNRKEATYFEFIPGLRPFL